MNVRLILWAGLLLSGAGCVMEEAQPNGSFSGRGAGGALLRSEFIYEQAPFPSCHASTLAESSTSLVAAWFGGQAEGAPDVGIWVSRLENRRWTPPVEVANGLEGDGKRHPCWNPVLFQPARGPLLLFYKVGPSPKTWWGMRMTSDDGGKTWSPPTRLPHDILGPIKNKPVQLRDGSLLCPSSTETTLNWRVFMETSPDLGLTWSRSKVLNDIHEYDAIQPAILVHNAQLLQVLCRSKQGRITESWSNDGGKTWRDMTATRLPNPNSGFDAVTLKDGRHLLIYNHTPRGRTPLNLAVSQDGQQWSAGLVLEIEPGEYSYPAIIQTKDGLVHATYTWKRQKIRHVVIDPRALRPTRIFDGQWP